MSVSDTRPDVKKLPQDFRQRVNVSGLVRISVRVARTFEQAGRVLHHRPVAVRGGSPVEEYRRAPGSETGKGTGATKRSLLCKGVDGVQWGAPQFSGSSYLIDTARIQDFFVDARSFFWLLNESAVSCYPTGVDTIARNRPHRYQSAVRLPKWPKRLFHFHLHDLS
jgi:hypothetical protein